MIKNNVTGLQSIHWSFEKPTRSALLTLAASLLIAACGGGSSEDGASATGASSSSTAPDFASLEDCMSTQWILVADQATRGANAIAAPGVSISTTGQALVDIARDGTYTYSPSFTINMQTPAGPASGRTSPTRRSRCPRRTSSRTSRRSARCCPRRPAADRVRTRPGEEPLGRGRSGQRRRDFLARPCCARRLP